MLKNISRIFFVFMLFVSVNVSAEQRLYPKVIENNEDFYIYTVAQGEGLWSISRRFGVTQAELYQHNEMLNQGLKVGARLKIPVRKPVYQMEETPVNISDKYIEHVVEAQQTLYSISKKYNVAIAEIIAMNPSMSNPIRVGEHLKIPVNKELLKTSTDTVPYIEHKVKRRETFYGISKKYGVEINRILEFNGIQSGDCQHGRILLIPQPKPEPKLLHKRSESINAKIAEQRFVADSVEVVAQDTNALKIAMLLPFKLNSAGADKTVDKFFDFYKGSLLALEYAKKMGISVELFVFDTENSNKKLEQILRDERLKNVDLIIGPAYTNLVQTVASFAKEQQVYTVIPFSSHVSHLDQNPYVIQYNPSQDVQFDLAIDLLLEKHGNKHFLISYFDNVYDKGNAFAKALEKRLSEQNKSYHVTSITPLNADSIINLNGKKTLLVLASNKKALAQPVVRAVNAFNHGHIEFWGFDDWGTLLMECSPVYYYSFFITRNTFDVTVYKENYDKNFGMPSSTETPRYDMIGYDLMRYMIKMLRINRQNPTIGFQLEATPSLQSGFKFKKVSEHGGWMNTNIYLHYLN